MRSYFATGCCGMNPRTGSVMAGIYMIMVCIMQIIFNRGNLRDARQRLNITIINTPDQSWLMELILSLYYFTYFLLVVTLCMCFLLLLSIYRQLYRGLLVYVGWLFLYETINTVVLSVTEIFMKRGGWHIRATEWFGYSIRVALHCFWLIYVISYALELANVSGTPLFQSRRLSRLSRTKHKTSRTPPTLKFAMQQQV